jgi:hypothetical protein
MDDGPPCIVGSLALLSRRYYAHQPRSITLGVRPPSNYHRPFCNFYITRAVADSSYSSGSLAGARQLVVSIVSYSIGKRVSCSSVSHF